MLSSWKCWSSTWKLQVATHRRKGIRCIPGAIFITGKKWWDLKRPMYLIPLPLIKHGNVWGELHLRVDITWKTTWAMPKWPLPGRYIFCIFKGLGHWPVSFSICWTHSFFLIHAQEELWFSAAVDDYTAWIAKLQPLHSFELYAMAHSEPRANDCELIHFLVSYSEERPPEWQEINVKSFSGAWADTCCIEKNIRLVTWAPEIGLEYQLPDIAINRHNTQAGRQKLVEDSIFPRYLQ